MDEQALNELLECSVCLEQLDDTSKVLPCQHTFCKRCLEEIVSTKHELRCPECRFLVEMRVEDLPTNILLIRLLEGLKTQARVSTSQARRRDTAGSPEASNGNNQTVAAFARQQQQRQASNSSRPCAKALFNYEATDPSDLSFKKGDIVYLRKQVDENWYHGELNGQHGFFPANFVQVITALPDTIPQCKGLYDFNVDNEKEDDCLPFRKDDIMTVIRRVDENWLEVQKGDKIGILPISFVELNDPAKILLSLTDKNSITPIASTSTANPGPPITPAHPVRVLKEDSPGLAPPVNKRHSLSTIPLTLTTPPNALQRRSLDSSTDSEILTAAKVVAMVTQPPVVMTSSMPAVMATPQNLPSSQPSSVPLKINESESASGPSSSSTPEVVTMEAAKSGVDMSTSMSVRSEEAASTSSAATPAIFVAMYNYKPQKADEVELIKGDYYSVTEKCLDGWFKGMAIKTGHTGVFPGNYVQMKTIGNSVKSSSRSMVTKPKQPQPPVQGLSSANGSSRPTVSPPRPKTSSSVAVGRSRSSGDSERRSLSAERHVQPPPIVPRSMQNLTPPTTKGSTSSSNPNSPILTTAKTTRYVRTAKSTSPNMGAKSEATGSPVWKHSLSASANITPPNVVVGAAAMGPIASGSGKEKEKKKDKEKLSLMKRITSAGKLKKPKSADVETASLSDSSVSHSRSGSYPSETSPLVSVEPGHKKSGSFDSSSQAGAAQSRPARPKPLAREKYRCIESYPAQSEIELDLKIGDIIYVHKKRDDGWFKGTLQRSGKTGLFPGSFAEKAS